MNEYDEAPVLTVDEIVTKIHRLQEEIVDREKLIVGLVDAAERPEVLEALVEEAEERQRMRHLERLVGDWDALVARSRALSEDDIDLIAAMVRLIGDLLIIQPEGLATKWLTRLEAYLEDQRAKVS